jgi:hypothetical protein
MKLTNVFSRPYSLLFGYDIFISYTRDGSKEYARKLYEQLTSLDYSCFIDNKEVPGGRSLNSSLNAALKGSKTLILIGTSRALQREYVQLEFAEFANTGHPIIPINVASAITIGTVLEAKPWSVIRERDLVWIDETAEAVTSGLPSPEVYEGVQNLFQFTRRNVVRRRWTTVAVVAILVAALAAIWQARTASAQAQIAVEQTKIAKTQTHIAEDRKAEIESQTRKLEEEQLKLAGKNKELEGKKTELEAKTREALTNANKARKQEALARTNAATAERRQRSAESLYLADQGRREYGTNPMLGLALSLEALQHVPSDDKSTRTAIERNVRDRIAYGRIARLDQGDFGKPYFLQGRPFFVLSRPGKAGALLDTQTGTHLQTLPGEVDGVTDPFYKWDQGAVIKNQIILVDSDLPYFLVHYKDVPAELRRRSDASVAASGDIGSVGARFNAGDPYFLIRYQNAPGELRRVDNDNVSVPLSDKSRGEDISLTFVPGAPYFLVTYERIPPELRRVDTGEIVERLSLKSISPSRFELAFSRDRAYYAISYSPDLTDPRAELRRTDTNKAVTLGPNVKRIFFSPVSNQLVVDYLDAPGELRHTDGEEVIRLSGRIREVVFNQADNHFVVLYSDAPGEIRQADGHMVIALSARVESLRAAEKGPGFWINGYGGDGYVALLHVKDNRLEELPIQRFDSGEAIRPAYFIARNPVAGHEEIRRAESGEVLRLTGKLAAANVFRYRSEIPYIQIGCKIAPPLQCDAFGLLHTGTGKLTPLNFAPHRITLSPKGTLFVVERDGGADLHNTETGEIVASSSYEMYFSPDDAYVVTDNDDHPDELVWTKTAKVIKLADEVSKANFNATSSLVKINYKDQPTELRRTSDGEILMTVKDVSFSKDGYYFTVTYENDQSELWAAKGAFHRLANLESGVAGVEFDTLGGRAFIWYNDRHAYLLDLNWLNAIGGVPEKLGEKELINIACQPFTDRVIEGLELKRFVQNAPLQICRSPR